MKKKLESELISIAHRILKLKNKSELIQLHQETQKLYEKLSVLRFWEENFEDVKPTIGHAEIEEKLETAYKNKEIILAETYHEDSSNNDRVEEVEKTLDDVNEPVEVLKEETTTETIEPFKNEIVFDVVEPKVASQKFTLEDLLCDVSSDPIFERVVKNEPNESKEEEEIIEDVITEEENPIEEEVAEAEEEIVSETEEEAEISEEIIHEEPIITSKESPKKETDKKTITLGLNDRVAFEKHLFGGSAADLNRVISQLITYDTFEEAQDFIEDMVKPDYKNWEGKEEYALRFMDIVEKKFH